MPGLRIALVLVTVITSLYIVLEFIFLDRYGLRYSKYQVISLIQTWIILESPS